MKRSSQVALLIMGTAGVGAATYSMTAPRKDCIALGTPPSAVAPVKPGQPPLEPCPPRRSWSSSSGYSYRSYWGWGGSSQNPSSRSTSGVPPGSVAISGRSGSSGTSRGASGGVARGGFGGTGHASAS
jgi:hypothetical protein